MVVVVVSEDGGGGRCPDPGLAHYRGPGKYPPKGDYPPGYDSDCNSDNSSSGRGSGDSDLGSEVDRDGSRLEDSGRYSCDGSHSDQAPSPAAPSTHQSQKSQKRDASPAHPAPINSSNNNQAPEQPKAIVSHESDIHGQKEVVLVHSRREPRSAPVTHPPVDAPLCGQCSRRDLSFFDPGCSGCSALLRRPTTAPAHVFAVMRQWVPQVQHNIHHFINQLLGMGCHVDDRDSLTDMTLLHYAVKAGSNGVGDPSTALQVVKQLLNTGADVHQRCRWTHMTALHYAAYFDVALVLDLLLQDPDGVNINDACLEYSGGAPLHIAAANLSLAAVRVLLQHGALATLTDTQGRTPFQCIPAADQYELVPDVQEVIAKLRSLLSPTASHGHTVSNAYTSSQGSSGKAVLKAMGLKLGDRVLVNGIKTGTLRFVGTTEFATGLWAGVELETPTGRHNGTVKGVMYFRCAKNYGIFVPVNRLTKIPHLSGARQGRSVSVAQRQQARAGSRRSVSLPPGRVNHGRVDVSKVSSRVAQDIRNTARKIVPGDRVYVDMGLASGSTRVVTGTVRYTGGVHFASGFWVGVELDVPRGTNDGSIGGNRYFSCKWHHGIFAAPSRLINYVTSRQRQEELDRAAEERKKEQTWCDPPVLPPATPRDQRKKRESQHWLQLGHNVFYKNEVGVIKYIGRVDFEQGVWLGVELRAAKGRHDGMVQGRRYFTCRPRHGIMVKPSKVYVRGINGAKLVKPENDYE